LSFPLDGNLSGKTRMNLRFTKMHGLGNDFILIDCREQACPSASQDLRDLSRRLCERRFGIGADQILLLEDSKEADFRMRIINADGSEVEMCGNGIRCLAKYIWDRRLSEKSVLEIETLAGTIRPEKSGDLVKVDMGEPILDPERIPVAISSSRVMDFPLRMTDREFSITCVSMGNPHAVIFVDDISGFPVSLYGPLIETHPLFPRRTNVEFVQVIGSDELRVRVWERGSGETLACGTGACAAAVASSLKGLTAAIVTVHLPGGDLLIEQSLDGHVYMTGPAVQVFEGVVDIS